MTDETPADAFDRYLKKVEETLPERRRYPGRRHALRRRSPIAPPLIIIICIGALLLGLVVPWARSSGSRPSATVAAPSPTQGP